jgi:peptidase A4-like protein
MRKPSRAVGIAVGALAAALTAGAFSLVPASAAVSAVTSSKVPAAIQPSTPLRAVGAGPGAAASVATSVTSLQSVNWAGYAASLGTTTFRFVSAQFTAPTLDCTGVTAASGAWSAHWVGLDGFRSTSTTVEQTGLLAGCNGTTPVYAPFWEMFPNAPGYPSITVNAGDTISMSVYYNRSTHKFTLTFSDATSGQKFTRTRACPAGATCRRNSAEAISEAPFDTTTSSVLPLADFQTANFANVSITNTTGTHRGGLRSSFWNTSRITQAAGNGTNTTITGTAIPEGTVLDSPTSLVQQRNFMDQWESANG